MAFIPEGRITAPQVADPMLPCPYRVHRVWRETRDTFTFALVPADGRERFSFAPGQFTMVYIFGVGEAPISISGDPGEPSLLVHTVRAVGPVTQAMGKLKRGDIVGVRGPYGNPWPVVQATGNDVVIAAGGLGLAPLRPALYHILSQREHYGRVVLLYGVRTSQDLLYIRELERWRGRFDLTVEVTVDSALDGWRGHVGVVTALIPRLQFDPLDTTALVCGPEIMMRFTIMDLLNRGVPSDNIFLSLERNMKCAIGFCGHCQFGPTFICKDGPVLRSDHIQPFFGKREI